MSFLLSLFFGYRQLSDAKSYLQRELSMLNTSCTDVDDVICLDDSLDEKSIFFFVQCNAELQKHRLGKVTHFLTFESNFHQNSHTHFMQCRLRKLGSELLTSGHIQAGSFSPC